MGKDRRIIHNNGREFGEIVTDPYGKKIVRNIYGEDVGEIEEDAAGNESIVKYEGDKKQEFGRIEFDPYKNREVIRRNDEEKDEEIEYVKDDSDFNPIAFGGALLLNIISAGIKGFYDGWRKSSQKKEDEKRKYQQEKNFEKQKLKERERLEELKRQELRRQYDLERIANDGLSSVGTRVAAVKNLTGQYELRRLAGDRYDHVDVRVAAIGNMNNQNELENLANDRYSHVDVREAARKRLESLKR